MQMEPSTGGLTVYTEEMNCVPFLGLRVVAVMLRGMVDIKWVIISSIEEGCLSPKPKVATLSPALATEPKQKKN